MSNNLKWGILGPGKIARKFAEELQVVENAEIYAVASRDMDRAKQFGSDFNPSKVYGSYLELAQDDEVDVVYVATPHAFHFEYTMLCLKHGKHVLVEKPMGMNEAEVETMMNEARSRGLFLMEGLWTRFVPATGKLLELINNKVIGDIVAIRADFGFKSKMDMQGRLFEKKLGGGSLLDIGIYPVYLSLLILGIPVDIMATARMTKTGVDSYCSMMFSYDNHSKASLESTLEAHTPIEAYIYGTHGKIKVATRFHHSERIELYEEEDIIEHYDLKYSGNGYVHEIEEVQNCIKEGKTESPRLPLKTSLQLTRILDKVRAEIGLQYE
ncbi:putative oxidoreductase YcjS [Salinivirga cyanobacteriivorans]|uniref:Putative oxidoreductase YcjS n=1 Tax=Salinivirga cyanobacteriivorans TaxID=1307839 RepID=A0A0S2HWN8_9BACT|nr:Gfo/Idh/MocA family oxidoreductase [Salinivirga cyanobacteriivorans]ALO14505.1 putative oxidoreductase YcjS [Salinivirga cyanobacteriivorans]